MGRIFYQRLTNIALVNDATHERISKGREHSHIDILSQKSFVIVSPHQNIICQIVDVGQGRQRNGICLFIFTQKSYCHRSFNMWCLPPIFASQKFRTKQRYYSCIQKPLNPNLFQVSTIPTQGLSKIPQVSCHRHKKAIKIASKCVRLFSVREN